MEQYTKELGIDMGNQNSASSAVLWKVGLNGQTRIINIDLSEKSGGNYVLNVIRDMTKKSLADMKVGTKGRKDYKNGTTLQGLNQHGIVVLKARKKSVADIVGKSFIRRKLRHVSAQSRVRCIKELIYLLENKLITL